VQPDRGREGPRSGDGELEPPGIPVEGLGEFVEILAPQGRRPGGVAPGSVDEAPPDRLQVDGQLDEQSGRAPDEVATRAAVGQLRQIGQAGDAVGVEVEDAEQVADGAQRLADVGAGPGADPTRGGHSGTSGASPDIAPEAPGGAAAMVADPTTRVRS